ncbi:ribosomal protein L10-domain-containing protein [Dunaliella salina]|uniref:60S acidic ribosomal protein P0 n=1 Tax=Dunaliella salina TaxID=3046 RepID=A0ABQ7G8Y3_DUNSA|nr:ribosomal protein L10-domain-containing protein [Dunaliella salina]|eukprot:KAF5831068.1 ribosomal protein L10-domain-containing protein [Dunaliella salina]
MPGASKIAQKEAYHEKVCKLLDTYDKAFIVGADNVGSMQFQQIRRALRPDAIILMGKNTMMKRSIKMYCETSGNDKWKVILDHLVNNVGIIFTNGDLNDVKEEINKYKVGAPARVNLIAPCDVHVPAGSTGMDPSQTSFFQALGIATKITKGTIEMVSDVQLVKQGERVGASQATLLSKLGIKPFKYGLEIQQVFENNTLYDPAVLDITDDDMLKSVSAAISNVAALSLATDYPTLASIPHSVINGYKNVLGLSLATDYTFPKAQKVKDMLANPEAFAAAAPAAAAPAPEEPKKEAAKEESEEEDMGFSLFD